MFNTKSLSKMLLKQKNDPFFFFFKDSDYVYNTIYTPKATHFYDNIDITYWIVSKDMVFKSRSFIKIGMRQGSYIFKYKNLFYQYIKEGPYKDFDKKYMYYSEDCESNSYWYIKVKPRNKK